MTLRTLPHFSTLGDLGSSVALVRIGDQPYALPLASVERVLPMAEVLSVPGAAEGLLGMLNLHGQVMPVVDPRAWLGLPTPAPTAEQRLVLIRTGAPYLLWVDAVDEVVVAAADALSEVPAQQMSPLVPRVLRMGERIVRVLAPAALEPRSVRR